MMNKGEMYLIRVPASTANLGPGFDSIGLALNLYLDVHVGVSDQWEVIPLTEEMKGFPADDSNYIVSVAKKIADYHGKSLEPCRLYVSSEIPLARGLGSSASAIVAGIELANLRCGLDLTLEEKNRHASLLEGHPDNAGASVYGGLVVGRHCEESTELLSFPLEEVSVVAVIPNYELLTEVSRNVLPEEITFKEAVQASAVSNTFLAALLAKQWNLAGQMMGKDLLHQPHRAKIVPHLKDVSELAHFEGAFGTALSGAGPTVVCFALKEHAEKLQESLAKAYPEFLVKKLQVDHKGSIVSKVVEEDLLPEIKELNSI